MARMRDEDSRADRFESQLRMPEVKAIKPSETHINKRLYKCSRCENGFEERSRHCPRCDTKTMGELRPIRESDRDRFREQNIAHIRRTRGL